MEWCPAGAHGHPNTPSGIANGDPSPHASAWDPSSSSSAIRWDHAAGEAADVAAPLFKTTLGATQGQMNPFSSGPTQHPLMPFERASMAPLQPVAGRADRLGLLSDVVLPGHGPAQNQGPLSSDPGVLTFAGWASSRGLSADDGLDGINGGPAVPTNPTGALAASLGPSHLSSWAAHTAAMPSQAFLGWSPAAKAFTLSNGLASQDRRQVSTLTAHASNASLKESLSFLSFESQHCSTGSAGAVASLTPNDAGTLLHSDHAVKPHLPTSSSFNTLPGPWCRPPQQLQPGPSGSLGSFDAEWPWLQQMEMGQCGTGASANRRLNSYSTGEGFLDTLQEAAGNRGAAGARGGASAKGGSPGAVGLHVATPLHLSSNPESDCSPPTWSSLRMPTKTSVRQRTLQQQQQLQPQTAWQQLQQQLQQHRQRLKQRKLQAAAASPSSPLQHRSVQENQPRGRSARLRWTPELHKRFVASVDSLGGIDHATPTAILALMKDEVTGLTVPHIKSHLQKHRMKCRAGDRRRRGAETPPSGSCSDGSEGRGDPMASP